MEETFLAAQRNYSRDSIDLAELSVLLPEDAVVEALSELDAKVGWTRQPSVAIEVMKRLVACEPGDTATHGFGTFTMLTPQLKSWPEVQKVCRDLGERLSLRLLGSLNREAPPPQHRPVDADGDRVAPRPRGA